MKNFTDVEFAGTFERLLVLKKKSLQNYLTKHTSTTLVDAWSVMVLCLGKLCKRFELRIIMLALKT